MKIEAYLFVPFRGQYRFAFEVHNAKDPIVIKESRKPFDMHWDMGMRSRPTLHELIVNERQAPAVRKEYEPQIDAAFRSLFDLLTKRPNSRLIKRFSQGYVEFVHVD